MPGEERIRLATMYLFDILRGWLGGYEFNVEPLDLYGVPR